MKTASPPKQTASAAVAGGATQRLARGRDIPGEWWIVFRSRALRSLIEQALIDSLRTCGQRRQRCVLRVKTLSCSAALSFHR